MAKLNPTIKIIRIFFLILTMSFNVFGVSIVETPIKDEPTSQAGAITFLTIFLMVILGLSLLGGFVLILVKIFKKLSDIARKKQDFYYSKFLTDDAQCNVNRDVTMKFRNWKMLWVFWKRKPIYINTENGLEILGYYNGETNKKENYYLISVYNKLGMFKYITQIVMIPNKMKHIVSKVEVEKSRVIIINCEGIDEIGNTDYYFMPLLKDYKDDKTYIDFSDLIHKEYFEKVIYRDIIKENLQQYRTNIIESIEANPYTQFNRRKD